MAQECLLLKKDRKSIQHYIVKVLCFALSWKERNNKFDHWVCR